ncbi:MAG: VRR-NUC domain-containing protein [Methylophilaceae bacterium]|nr:VRR-NUC domain-containing protein [Methylophilaceae bacterium]
MNNFILECSPKTKTTKPLEADSLREVMRALKSHHLVAWCERQNTGVAKVGGRFIKFGWTGCSDILGQLKDGRLLAVEVKKPKGGKLTDEQVFFLELVRKHGGVSFVATSLLDVFNNLGDINDK